MKIAVYTLTRDRLEYTQRCFQLLWEKAGQPFDHYVIDNGSTDGTQDWLKGQAAHFLVLGLLRENTGISLASNHALDMIGQYGEYDLIVKLDNDCEIVSDNLFTHMASVYEKAGQPLLLSPRVEGIRQQPVRAYTVDVGGWQIGRTGIVGGLCHWLPARLYLSYRYPDTLPKAWGQDDAFCDWCYRNNIPMGYVEALQVNHMDTTVGQAQKYPEYFKRKWQEEKREATPNTP